MILGIHAHSPLVEPFVAENLTDRPDLGCAMLIGACRQAGIASTLIKGQTDYLRYMFVEGSSELWELLSDLKKEDIERLQLTNTHRFLRRAGQEAFQDELKRLYEYLIVDKNPRHYLDAQAVERLDNLHRLFMVLYNYYIEHYTYYKLGIIERTVSQILQLNPDYVGFSLYRLTPLHRAMRQIIKTESQIPVIVGGAITPFLDFMTLDTLFKEEYFDYLVVGPGEVALPRLLNRLTDKKEPAGIANVYYLENGALKGGDLHVVENLDSLHDPDYSQFDLDLYLAPKRILPLQTARGCTWRKCTFCSHHQVYLDRYITFSIERITETLARLQSTYACSHFSFHDEEIPPKRARQISESILSHGIKNISIDMYARMTKGFNSHSLLRLMGDAGFTSINWGTESASQRVLDLMNKGNDASISGNILRICHENGIANMLFIMFGFPGETKDELQQTVDFLKLNAEFIVDIMWGTFVLDPHSPIGENPGKWGVRLLEDGNNGYESVVCGGLNSAEVERIFDSLEDRLRIDKNHRKRKGSTKEHDDRIDLSMIRYIPRGIICRMLHFLNTSQGIMGAKMALEQIIEGRLSDIFPVMLARIYRNGEDLLLYPSNIKETVYTNKYHPEAAISIGSVEGAVFAHANGVFSVEEIIRKVQEDLKDSLEESDVHLQCLDFIQRMFMGNYAIGYTNSWGNPMDKINKREVEML